MGRLVVFSLIALLGACSSPEHTEPDVEDVNVPADLGLADVPEDLGNSDIGEPDADPAPEGRVPIDLDSYVEGAIPGASVRAFVATTPEQLVKGVGARGRVGDYVIENDLARFVIQQPDRQMSPCSHSGNVIDAEYLGAGSGGDVLGEVCMFLNADQTFLPEEYEILHDGSEGYAVVAVTGRTAILDFLNFRSMAGMINESLANRIRVLPNDLMPLDITVYYVLLPDTNGLRVLTALRNRSEEQVDVVFANLVMTDGDGSYFNPLASTGGFGYGSGGSAFSIQPDRVPFIAYATKDAGFAYVPTPDPRIQADLPSGGSSITISGVAAVLVGLTDLINTLLATPEQLSRRAGVLHIAPGAVDVVDHRIFAGDGSLSTMLDTIYSVIGMDTGTVSGRVVDTAGAALEGVYVSAIDEKERTFNQTRTGADGAYEMALPGGAYTLVARLEGQISTTPLEIAVTDGASTADSDITMTLPATLNVRVRSPDGLPIPARITLICADGCANKPTSQERDMNFDGLPSNFAAVGWVDISGDHSVSMPPGDYQVVVSRGLEWSIWPQDAPTNGGFPITLVPGESIDIDAELARVIDSTGTLSGDFHIHAIASADSNVPDEERVLTFLAEGVHVLVSTDHDAITDFAPAIASLGAGQEIVSIVGSEITTSDTGHFNAFPLVMDPEHRRGGALDWGANEEPSLAPADIFEWIRAHPGEQVIQINHPDSSFLRYSDVLRGLSYGDPTRMRVQSSSYDPATGANDIWSDDFTALEIMNGHSTGRFWGVGRWWLTLLGRGLKTTGTAVTDTHRRYGDMLGGVPRTFVNLPEGKDSPATFDSDAFVASLNQGRAFGTNGPFVRVEATNQEGASGGLGDTLATAGGTVTFQITVEHADWMQVDTLDVYMNVDAAVTAPGEYDTSAIPPTLTFPIAMDEDDLETIAEGQSAHRRYRKVIEVEIDTDVDAYVVFVVHGDNSPAIYPVVLGRSVKAFAFTNAVYLDADGGGYDNPHLAERAATAAPRPFVQGDRLDLVPGALTPDDVTRIFHEISCEH